MELTGKQKRFLRGLGQRLAPSLNVGKAGLSPAVAAQLDRMLLHAELVKVHLPAAAPADRAHMADDLAAQTSATVAGVVGRTALLYRANESLEDDQRIHLPSAQGGEE